MIYRITHIRKTAVIGAIIMLLMMSGRLLAQCTWDIGQPQINDTSSCAGNGSIKVLLTGANVASLTGRQYSLTPAITGGYTVPPSSSDLFENVPPGSYTITVQGVCNGNTMIKTRPVTMTGGYVPVTASVAQRRAALPSCPTGQVFVTINNGRAPFQISITNAPTAYTGPRNFSGRTSLLVDQLAAGEYSFVVADSCGSATAAKVITVAGAPQMIRNDFDYALIPYGADCKKIGFHYFRLQGAYDGYSEAGTPLMYAYAYDGMPATSYKPASDSADLIQLPIGETVKSVYGKNLTVYFKSPCGNVWSFTDVINPPGLFKLATPNSCRNDFDLSYRLNQNAETVCYPVAIRVTNKGTNKNYYDTIRTISADIQMMHFLPFGDYHMDVRTADGYDLTPGIPDFTVVKPDPTVNPYSTVIYSEGVFGEPDVAHIILNKTSAFQRGTRVEVIYPDSIDYSVVLPVFGSTNAIMLPLPTNFDYDQPFTEGTYTLRVTDSCGSYLVSPKVTANSIYKYNWTYKARRTCAGLEITPNGTASSGFGNEVIFYQLLSPRGYDTRSIRNGETFLLRDPGVYRIGAGNYAGFIRDYGTDKNVKEITYNADPIAIDVDSSYGWVCPSAPDTDGRIVTIAHNGAVAALNTTGIVTYTYQLALEGQGTTGPYLAQNNTGLFSTATSGGAYTLEANHNYDVRASDECGAVSVQTIKIIDYTTAQIVRAERPEYCEGEIVRFQLLNLPAKAAVYKWTGPNGFTSSLRNPSFKMTPADSGTYHVEINFDICNEPIKGEVTIRQVPYIKVCYSAVTDTFVNPYVYGLMGNWHPVRSYAYYGARKESDPNQPTNIREDGTFDDFTAFWNTENQNWTPRRDDKKWVWNSESTIFSTKGFELENKDALGRYNAGLYGYDAAIPVAVIQNSRYQESAFEGFEDYAFETNACDTVCPVGRRFDFVLYKDKIDSTQKHTGRYSLKLKPKDTVGISAQVVPQGSILTDLTTVKAPNDCTYWDEFKGMLADSGVIIPSFSPIAGKKMLFSAWVKEEQDCKCSSYDNNEVTLAVTDSAGRSTAVRIKPTGAIIDGWQRYEYVVDVPTGSTALALVLIAKENTTVYYDDIRFHPYNANMKSFVYDPKSLRMMAELDENNYATFFEYDDDATLTRVKKETERGVKTIRETRSALIKE